MKSIAFFDFDGTLTEKDAFWAFLRHSISTFKLIFGTLILSPILGLYFLKIISNDKAKEIVFVWFFKGMKEVDFLNTCEGFCKTIIPTLLRKEAIEKFTWHKNQGHTVVIVSANFDLILQEWCSQMRVELISTKLLAKDGYIEKFASNNCHGEEKVIRINEKFDLGNYTDIYAYGDSKGDLPMLKLANHPFYRSF